MHMMKDIFETVLKPVHTEAQAKMDDVAGFYMPISYPNEPSSPSGKASLCDISHRPQLIIDGPNATAFVAEYFGFNPDNEMHLHSGRLKDAEEGINTWFLLHPLEGERFFVILEENLGEKDATVFWLSDALHDDTTMTLLKGNCLLSVQGIQSRESLNDADLDDGISALTEAGFYESKSYLVTKLAETAETGYFISVDEDNAVGIWQKLTASSHISVIGLDNYNKLSADKAFLA